MKAQAPLVSMFGYSTALRSATQGRATFTMEFSHFAEKVGGFGEAGRRLTAGDRGDGIC